MSPFPPLFDKEIHITVVLRLLLTAYGERYREEVRDHGTFFTGVDLHVVIGLLSFVDDGCFGKSFPPGNIGFPAFEPPVGCRHDRNSVRVDVVVEPVFMPPVRSSTGSSYSCKDVFHNHFYINRVPPSPMGSLQVKAETMQGVKVHVW